MLADIAQAHGIDIPIPTADKLESKLNEAIAYAEDRIRELLTPDKDLSYKGFDFFNYPHAEDGWARQTFNELDMSAFTTEE